MYAGCFGSGYWFRCKWWTGKTVKTHGQPIDQALLDEDGEESGLMGLLMQELMGDEFNERGMVVTVDKAFGSVKNLRAVDAQGN